MVSSENGFLIRPKRPRARGRPRFMVRFFPTYASATISSSTSRLWLFSALAIADCRHFLTSIAIRRFEKVEIGHGLLDLLAADHCRDQVQLSEATCEACAVFAIASLSATRRGFFALAHDLLPFRFFVGRVTIIGARRGIFAELLTDHVFGHVEPECASGRCTHQRSDPTNCGRMVERRDQILMTSFRPDSRELLRPF